MGCRRVQLAPPLSPLLAAPCPWFCALCDVPHPRHLPACRTLWNEGVHAHLQPWLLLPSAVTLYESGWLALWSSVFGVWSAAFYHRTGRAIYPFLGGSWSGKLRPGVGGRELSLGPPPHPTPPTPHTHHTTPPPAHLTDVSKPYAWAAYLGIFGTLWVAYLLFMGLARRAAASLLFPCSCLLARCRPAVLVAGGATPKAGSPDCCTHSRTPLTLHA